MTAGIVARLATGRARVGQRSGMSPERSRRAECLDASRSAFVSEGSQASLRERIASATTADEALGLLKQSGASPIDAIRALRERFGISLTDAKMALHSHPAWATEARAAEELHDELEAILNDLRPAD